jgi:hypothetical protein
MYVMPGLRAAAGKLQSRNLGWKRLGILKRCTNNWKYIVLNNTARF